MGRRTQLEKGEAATLAFYPPQDGVPTAATVTIYTSGTSALVAETAATIDSYSEAVSSVSKHDRVLTVTSAPTPGRRYWLADSDGLGTEIVCRGGTATRLVLEQPAPRAITSGTVSGRRISYALTASQTATLRRYLRVRWEYTIGGETHVYQQLVDVVHWPFDLDVSEAALERIVTSFGETVGDYRAWTHLVAQAVDDVWDALVGEQLQPDLVRDRTLLETAAAWRTLALRYVREPQRYEQSQAEYQAALGRFFKSRAWYDTDDDLARDLGYGSRLGYLPDGTQIALDDGEGVGDGGAGEELGAPMSRLKVG